MLESQLSKIYHQQVTDVIGLEMIRARKLLSTSWSKRDSWKRQDLKTFGELRGSPLSDAASGLQLAGSFTLIDVCKLPLIFRIP